MAGPLINPHDAASRGENDRSDSEIFSASLQQRLPTEPLTFLYIYQVERHTTPLCRSPSPNLTKATPSQPITSTTNPSPRSGRISSLLDQLSAIPAIPFSTPSQHTRQAVNLTSPRSCSFASSFPSASPASSASFDFCISPAR